MDPVKTMQPTIANSNVIHVDFAKKAHVDLALAA
jgi:hypothetical protein